MLWLDCDREGENIACDIRDLCVGVNRRLRVYRGRFSALIPADIYNAGACCWLCGRVAGCLRVTGSVVQRDAVFLPSARTLGFLDEKLSAAVEARREIDLRRGAAFTRFQVRVGVCTVVCIVQRLAKGGLVESWLCWRDWQSRNQSLL